MMRAKQGARIACVAALVALAGCGGSGSSTSTSGATTSTAVTTGGAPAGQPFTATLQAPGHSPRARAPWPITIRVATPNGRPLAAVVRYQYLFGGQVVARRSRYRFTGTFHDTLRWPERSVGYPLTFRAVVTTALGRRILDYDVTVRG